MTAPPRNGDRGGAIGAYSRTDGCPFLCATPNLTDTDGGLQPDGGCVTLNLRVILPVRVSC